MAAGLASIFAAAGGLSEQTGYPDGPPSQLTDPMAYRAGTAFTVGILAALLDRTRTGRGQHVDFSSREVFAASATDALLAHVIGVPWQLRLGNGHRTMAPHDVYPCKDGGWLAIAVGDDREREGLTRVIGQAVEGPGSDGAIREWTATRSREQAAEALLAAGVPASPVMTFADLAEDPHLIARKVFAEVEHPVLGPQKVMRAPWLCAGWDNAVLRPGPLLAADNEEVLAGLDMTPARGEPRATEASR
jgi:crotonobetainyl-CoA:carnitine CoA-transferase CaiB-like acyl-CoA transferase